LKLTDSLREVAGDQSLGTWTEPASGRELPLVTPTDEATAVRIVRFATDNQLALIPIGLGGKTSLTSAAQRVDFAVSTRGLSGVEAYEPGDGTVTVRAGTTMSELREVVNAGGHRLTPDVPLPESATIGGVVAAGQSGFDRLRYGPLRNHVLGLRVLLGDGTVARTGGRLVKNVTGYDLQRLYTGSRGSLCLILEASLRLFALPEDELAFAGTTSELGEALDAVTRLSALPLTWDTLTITGNPGEFRVFGALAGRSLMLSAHRASVSQALHGLEALEVHEGTEAREACNRTRDAELEGGWPDLRLYCRPSELVGKCERLHAALTELGETRSRLGLHPELASLDITLASTDPERRRELLAELHEVSTRHALRIEWLASHLELPERPPTAETAADRLMARLQHSLDPAGVFARGRFYRGL